MTAVPLTTPLQSVLLLPPPEVCVSLLGVGNNEVDADALGEAVDDTLASGGLDVGVGVDDRLGTKVDVLGEGLGSLTDGVGVGTGVMVDDGLGLDGIFEALADGVKLAVGVGVDDGLDGVFDALTDGETLAITLTVGVGVGDILGVLDILGVGDGLLMVSFVPPVVFNGVDEGLAVVLFVVSLSDLVCILSLSPSSYVLERSS